MKGRIKAVLGVCAVSLTLLLSGCEKTTQESVEETFVSPAPTFVIEQSTQEAWHENGEDKLAEGSFTGLRITGEPYEALKMSVETWNQELFQNYEETYSNFLEWAREQNELVEGIFHGYAVEYRTECTRADSDVLSVLLFCYEYAGGAHGNYGYQAVCFDTKTGARLQFKDLFSDAEGFLQWAKEEGFKRLEKEYADGLFPDAREVYTRSLDENPVWFLDGAGLHLVYNPYELAPYAVGEVMVSFTYDECGAFMKPEYGKPFGSGTAEIPWDTQLSVLLLEEQVPHTMRLWIDSDETKMGQVCLDLDGTTHPLEIGEQGGSAYLVKKENGSVYLLYDADPASEDDITYVYDLNGEVPVLKAREDMEILKGSVSADRFKASVRVDFLGTYRSLQEYELTKEGTLHRISEEYSITSLYGEGILTVKQPIPAVCMGEEKMLPAGTRLFITWTDLEGVAGYRLVETGEEGELHFRYLDDTKTYVEIGGIRETECFEDLPYAG